MLIPAQRLLGPGPEEHGVFSNRDIHSISGVQPRARETSCMVYFIPDDWVLVRWSLTLESNIFNADKKFYLNYKYVFIDIEREILNFM